MAHKPNKGGATALQEQKGHAAAAPYEPTIEELEAMLEKRKAAEKERLASARKAYENTRERLLATLCVSACNLQEQLSEFKRESFEALQLFREQMLAYGDLRNGTSNKGNFEVKNEHFKIQFSSHILKRFDERAELAEEKLKTFLKTFVKKRDKEVFELVNALLERNEKNGDFDINLINRLYQLEDRFDDENWRDGIRLFKESYSPSGTAQYARFYTKDEAGKWEQVPLDFSKAKTGK